MKTVQRIVGTILVIIGIAIMLTPLYHTGQAWYPMAAVQIHSGKPDRRDPSR